MIKLKLTTKLLNLPEVLAGEFGVNGNFPRDSFFPFLELDSWV